MCVIIIVIIIIIIDFTLLSDAHLTPLSILDWRFDEA